MGNRYPEGKFAEMGKQAELFVCCMMDHFDRGWLNVVNHFHYLKSEMETENRHYYTVAGGL